MALMKAKTANEKASSVDKTALVLVEIDEQIRHRVNEGGFSTLTCVTNEDVEPVRSALQKAGYSVTIPTVMLVPTRPTASWWERLFNIPTASSLEGEMFFDNHTRLAIDWSLVRETKTA